MSCNPEPQNSTNRLPQGTDRDSIPQIKVVFRGFIITHIGHATTEEALVGALLGSACHKPIVHIYEIRGDVTTDITKCIPNFHVDISQDFSLRVGNQVNIQRFQKDEEKFNRLDEVGNDKKDFRWFVDFNEIHERPAPHSPYCVVIDRTQLKPKFILNRGIFHASKLSDGEVMISRRGGRPPKRFGRFATEITARIVLGSDEVAVFQNGTQLFTITARDGDPRYEIVFDCSCRSADETVSDFDHIYQAVKNDDGSVIVDTVQLDALGAYPPVEEDLGDLDPKPTTIVHTPEVYCTGGNG